MSTGPTGGKAGGGVGSTAGSVRVMMSGQGGRGRRWQVLRRGHSRWLSLHLFTVHCDNEETTHTQFTPPERWVYSGKSTNHMNMVVLVLLCVCVVAMMVPPIHLGELSTASERSERADVIISIG